MASSDIQETRLLTPADDDFHPGTDPWFTEGSWWGLQLPSHHIGCWIYHQTRRNLGIASGGVWLWDASRSSCFELPYYNNRQIQLLDPGSHDLNDFTWPDGVRLRTLEPLNRYRLTFDDPGRLTFDLVFTALIEPAILSGGAPPRPHRLDQACSVSGHMEVHGERIAVDCLGFRDHSWEVRPEAPISPPTRTEEARISDLAQRPVVYLYGTASARDAFFLLAPGSVPMASCYVIRDGARRAVKETRQEIARNAEDGHIENITLHLLDASGDTHRFTGVTRSWMMRPSPVGLGLLHVVEWTIGEHQGWGELQDIWPIDLWSRYRRAATA